MGGNNIGGVGHKPTLPLSPFKNKKPQEDKSRMSDVRNKYLNTAVGLPLKGQTPDERIQERKEMQNVLKFQMKELNETREELKTELKKEVPDQQKIDELRKKLSQLIQDGQLLTTRINISNKLDDITSSGLKKIKEKIERRKTDALQKKLGKSANEELDKKQALRQMKIAALREKLGIGSPQQLRAAARQVNHLGIPNFYPHEELIKTSTKRDLLATRLDQLTSDHSPAKQNDVLKSLRELKINDKMRMKAYRALTTPEMVKNRKDEIENVIKRLDKEIDEADVLILMDLIQIADGLSDLEDKKRLLEYLNKKSLLLEGHISKDSQATFSELKNLKIPTDEEISQRKYADTTFENLKKVF